MSHEIVYQKQFLKTEDGNVIPLVSIGSNNCYTNEIDSRGRGYEKRSRDWSAIYSNGSNQNVSIAPEKLLEIVEKYTGGNSYQQHFKMYSKWVDDAGLIRFMKSGIKNAKTIEELSELNAYPIELRAGFSVWYKSNEQYSDGSYVSKNKFEDYKYIKTSQDLTEFLNFADERIKTKLDNESVYVHLSFTSEKAIPYPKNKKTRSNKEKPEEYWTIIRADGAYLKKLTRGGARLSYYKSDSKCFNTEKAANTYIEKNLLNSRFSSKHKYSAEFISR